ncbi:hypothetical protein [Roseomonas sp. CECT 9278]|uniref:hypothetical protein n=1 Tax=Roseomonas sp. CECT 9278 TaxID=2845823 RepID=UPI001E400E67|nr:hypothetical protein [Roseomonas sp. CECT 9278]CAH0134419.1 hypothetical protein ROS9278_00314 [Roseomonas sp. CECT 9278]
MSLRAEVAAWPDETLLRRKEAATYLDCRHQLLEEWAVQGIGPKYIKNGRWVRYRMGDLRAWVRKHERRTINRRRVILGQGVAL